MSVIAGGVVGVSVFANVTWICGTILTAVYVNITEDIRCGIFIILVLLDLPARIILVCRIPLCFVV